jgi:predicted NAD-dependent protein-ADP-ribosyltransferase YbiA (DUF1768 family)
VKNDGFWLFKFYAANDGYGCFSNIPNYGFEQKGKYRKTGGLCFQAQKSAGTIYEDEAGVAKAVRAVAKRPAADGAEFA